MRFPFPKPPTDSGELLRLRESFLANRYLREAYLVPSDISGLLTTTTDQLQEEIPGLLCVVNVGGTANGSLELRRQEKPNAATDVDVYIVGGNETIPRLNTASRFLSNNLRAIDLTLDGELNGRREDNFLNVDDIEGHIEREEFNLLALPFQSAFGKVNEARLAVLYGIADRSDKQAIWDEVASYHAQSLSMHHGSWPIEFNDLILQTYYPAKVSAYELALTPDEALANLLSDNRK